MFVFPTLIFGTLVAAQVLPQPLCVAPAAEWRLNMPCGCFFLNRTLSDPAVCLAGSVVQVAHQGLRCVAGTNGGDAVYCSPKWGSCERSIARDVAAPVARCVNYAMTLDYNAGLVQRVIYEPPANAAEREDFDPEDWTSRQWVSWRPALLNNGSTDDCGSEALIFTTPGFPHSHESDCPSGPGLVNVTLVVADRAGRTSRCVAAVNVITAISLPKKGTLTFAVVNEPLTLGTFGGAGQAELACRKDIRVSISPDKISCANVNRVTLGCRFVSLAAPLTTAFMRCLCPIRPASAARPPLCVPRHQFHRALRACTAS
jgi:hypothetical protein